MKNKADSKRAKIDEQKNMFKEAARAKIKEMY
jgi:hypothetical protein